MPNAPFLTAKDLVSTLTKMAGGAGAPEERKARKTFETMTVYVEACESGSIFDGLLEPGLGIYVTTAANPTESSWGTYCPGQKSPPPPKYGTCLGDLYSVSFLENSDEVDLRKESLLTQYRRVKRRASANYTYHEGSHVMRYGERDVDLQEASDFLGRGNKGGFTPEEEEEEVQTSSSRVENVETATKDDVDDSSAETATHAREDEDVRVHQRDAELIPLWHAVMHAADSAERSSASRRLRAELNARDALDADVAAAANEVMTSVMKARGSDSLSVAADADVALAAVRPAGQPLTDDWDCFKGMLEAWAGECGYISQYGMRHGRTLANLCNAGVRPRDFAAAAAKTSCRRGGVGRGGGKRRHEIRGGVLTTEGGGGEVVM